MDNDPPSFAHHDRADELFDTARSATAALYPEARIPETPMPRYRKKPIVVDAWQWNAEHKKDRPSWLNETGVYLTWDSVLVVPTLEGDMFAEPGDWIIRGIKGEVYPCKPDIFAETYELVP